MTEMQLLMQIRFLLQARTWAEHDGTALGSAAKVFGDNVVISAGAANEDILSSLSLPCAVVIPGSSIHDEDSGDDPRVLTTQPRVRIITAVQGDMIGQGALIGHDISDEGLSAGHGLLEIQEQLHLALEHLGKDDSVFLKLTAQSIAAVVSLEDMGNVNLRDYEFSAKVTTRRHYPRVPTMTLTSAVADQIVAVWVLPADRYDRLRVKLRIGTAQATEALALANAPTAHDGGSSVTVSGGDNGTTGTATSLTTGQWYGMSVFEMYDDRNATPATETDAQSSVALSLAFQAS
jgi:hypothetical protein